MKLCTTAQTWFVPRKYPAEVGKVPHPPSTLLIVLIIVWLLGVGTSFTLGGLIHILLVIAIAVVLLRVIQGRHPLQG
jgi:Family of unknown function (DUF5670)